MNDTMIQVEFDETQATTYQPHRMVKQAVLVPVPDDTETIINAEWGSTQTFLGPWYAVYSDGNVSYGVAKAEFEETHGSTDEVENGYFKNTPADSYQYHGPTANVTTVLANGTVETENTISDGDWLVKWPHGEVGVLKDDNFRKRYSVG